MQAVMNGLHIDATTGGWLMSAFAVTGIVLGIPSALVLRRLGPKLAGLVALGCTVLGSVVGALANDAPLLLAGRVVEGVGLGLIAVVAPAVISLWFAPHERGTPMGIWWFGAGFALIAFVIYAIVVSAPHTAEGLNERVQPAGGSFGRLLLNPASWILALVFGAFNFVFIAYATWAPSYFSQSLGVSPEAASFNASLLSLAVIPSTVIAGWALDHIKNRHLILTVALAMSGLSLFWGFRLGSAGAIGPYMLVVGLVAGFVPSATFTLAPETMPSPQLAGLALGIVSVGQNLGMFFGPPIVGGLIASGNWAAGTVPLMVAVVVGVAASIGLQARRASRQVALTAE